MIAIAATGTGDPGTRAQPQPPPVLAAVMGTQRPPVHWFDWHVVASLHGWPFGWPHTPLAQIPAAQSVATAHEAPLSSAHVEVWALHAPVAQTAAAVAGVHVPSWRLSLGKAAPAGNSSAHIIMSRRQNEPLAQSPST